MPCFRASDWVGSIFQQEMRCCAIILERVKHFPCPAPCVLPSPLLNRGDAHPSLRGLQAWGGGCLRPGVHSSLCWRPVGGALEREEDSPDRKKEGFGQCGLVLQQQRLQKLISPNLKGDYPKVPQSSADPQNCEIYNPERIEIQEYCSGSGR